MSHICEDYYVSRGIKMPILASFIVPHPPLIIPEIGGGEELQIQNTVNAYHTIAKQIAELKPQTIIVISPHGVMYSDFFHISPGPGGRGDMSRFRAPQVVMRKKYDSSLIYAIAEAAKKKDIPSGVVGQKDNSIDHGTLIPLYFVDQYYTDYELVRISISGLSLQEHYRFGECVGNAANLMNRNVVIIASGDLSHKLGVVSPYGFAEEGPVFDRQITKAMAGANFMNFLTFDPEFTERASECGLRSFIIMAGALDGLTVKSNLLSYEGPFGIGYAVCAFDPQSHDENRHFGVRLSAQRDKYLKNVREGEDLYVQLARIALETYVRTMERMPAPFDLPEELLEKKAGVFVSIKKDGRLRGCIGTIEPQTTCIAEEIIRNAISSGTKDPRFDCISDQELKHLEYSVDVLGTPEKIADKSTLDPKRYGVIVRSDLRQGILLPNLEGVDTVDRQIEIVLQKAGIRPGTPYDLERFEVIRHK